ncbi:unnamed protein product, partial [Ixodes pacificus]
CRSGGASYAPTLCSMRASVASASSSPAFRPLEKQRDPHQPPPAVGRRLRLGQLSSLREPDIQMSANRMDTSYTPKVLRKTNDCMVSQEVGAAANESRVLVLYSGGTIGMVRGKDGGEFRFMSLSRHLRHAILRSNVPGFLRRSAVGQ